jgi:hypothetical protein
MTCTGKALLFKLIYLLDLYKPCHIPDLSVGMYHLSNISFFMKT